jgi:hypothetical protein
MAIAGVDMFATSADLAWQRQARSISRNQAPVKPSACWTAPLKLCAACGMEGEQAPPCTECSEKQEDQGLGAGQPRFEPVPQDKLWAALSAVAAGALAQRKTVATTENTVVKRRGKISGLLKGFCTGVLTVLAVNVAPSPSRRPRLVGGSIPEIS